MPSIFTHGPERGKKAPMSENIPPFAEKLEACPDCGEIKRWLYDAQICATCGHGDRFKQSREAKDTLFDLGDGQAIRFNPNGRFHGWIFRKHPDGQYVSVRKAAPLPMPETP